MLPGHKVVASSGKFIYGLGTAIGTYTFNPDLYYQHSKPVRWEQKFWAPLDVRELSLSQELANRLGRNRTIMELKGIEWERLEEAVYEADSPFEGLTNFEGLCRAPETEQEVIILFSKLSQHLKMKIEFVGTRFPDALVRVKEGERWVTKYAEFEKSSSDFEAHGHLKQMKKGTVCDLIICWKDDWKQRPRDLHIVELRRELEEIV